MKNQVHLIGFVGQNPEVKVLENGSKLTKFSLATNDYYVTREGERVEQTQWHRLVAWGKQAEIAEKYVNKGRLLQVEGQLVYRNYEDAQGQKHYVTEIRVNEILLLDKK